MSHTPQLVRGYPCTGPCSPEVAEVLRSHRRRSFGASHTAHRLDNRPSCHKHERNNDVSMLARHDAHWNSLEGGGCCPRLIIQKIPSDPPSLALRDTQFVTRTLHRHDRYTASKYIAPVQGQFWWYTMSTGKTCRADLRPNQPPIRGILP